MFGSTDLVVLEHAQNFPAKWKKMHAKLATGYRLDGKF